MKSHAFHPEARAEFDAEARFYETQRPGFGWRFKEEIARAVNRVCEFPLSGAPTGEGVGKLVVSGFPFIIFYELLQDRVVIWAIMHCSRRPGCWQHRRLSTNL